MGTREERLIRCGALKVFDLEKTMISVDQPVLYFLVDGPRRGFVREQLLVVPEDTGITTQVCLEIISLDRNQPTIL